MKKVKYFIFSLICLFSCGIVFAKDEISVEKMIPVYDENSGVIVSEENGEHSVIFNDKDQSVKYNVVLKNNTNKDIPIENLSLPKPTEDFLKYELTGLNSGDVIKANSTKDVVISLETVKTEGWGRNFNMEFTTVVNYERAIENPHTGASIIAIIVGLIILLLILFVLLRKQKSLFCSLCLLGILVLNVQNINAQEIFYIPIKLKVGFESQNVMLKSDVEGYSCQPGDACFDEDEFIAFWKHTADIKNIYIVNEIREVNDYAYKYDVSEKQNGRVLAYLLNNESDNSKYDLYLMSDGIIYPNEDASYYFSFMFYLDEINNLEGLDTSNVTNMSYMFYYTGSDSEIFTLDLSNFDTSNVTDMSNMFNSTGSYNNPNFTLDVSDFDTSSVTDMSGMFHSAGYSSSIFTLDVSNFDTSNVSDMNSMFSNTGYNNPTFTLDVSNFDTSNVTNMGSMFYSTGYNNPTFTLDVSNFDTSNVTSMSNMFNQAGYSSPNFTLDVSNFDTSNVIDMRSMFSSTGYSSSIFTLDVSNFDTSNVTNMSNMFNSTGWNNPNFTLDVSNFDTSNVTNMWGVFCNTGYNSTVFTLDVSNFDTSNVTNMSNMFNSTGYNNPNFTLDVSNFDTSKVTSMSSMFENTGYNSSNFTLDVSSFDTSKVTNMSSMFKNTGYNSTAFVTTFTIRPKITNSSYYKEMFSGVATKPGSKITVNYTSANSSYINTYINTKSTNSNVVKGVRVD